MNVDDMANKSAHLCSICGLQHQNAGALARHKAKHDPPGGFLCRVCKAPFTTEEARQQHKRETHIVHRCFVCKNKFNDEKEYRDHVSKTHAGCEQKPHEICDACGTQFGSLVQLRKHVDSKCGTEKPFKCDICNRTYQTSASLKNHMVAHQKGKPHLCGFCGASFLNRGQLKIHERVHTGEKPYKCDKCDKAFSYRESLITHSTIHTGIKPFFCMCCDARFSCVGNLIKHRKLRPGTCGLPKYNPTNRVTPRPTKKTMPSLTDRKRFPNTLEKVLGDPSDKALKNVHDTWATMSYGMGARNCDEKMSSKIFEQNTLSCLNDDDDVINEDNNDFEYETVELFDSFINPGEQVDISTTADICNYSSIHITTTAVPIDTIEEQQIDSAKMSNEETADNEIGFSNDIIPQRDSVQSNDQGTDSNEKHHLVTNEIEETQELNVHVLQKDHDMNFLEPTALKLCDNRGKRVEVLSIQLIHDGEFSEEKEEEIGEDEQNICSALGDKEYISRNDETSHVVDAEVFEAEKGFKYESESDLSNHTTSEKVQKSKTHTEELNQMAIEKEDKLLHEQLEVVKQNSVCSSNVFVCKLCPQQYSTVYLMARHLERMHDFLLDKAREKLQFTKATVHEKRFRCKFCEVSYVNAARLKAHIIKHGVDGQLRHKCPACVTYFETEEAARRHALEEHREQLVCKICEKEFKEPDSLQQHVRYAHKGMKEARKRRYMCHRCGKYFITRNIMSDHERANCGQSPIYRCETCGKNYASFASLKVHQTMHQNLLPYECEVCGKRFRVKGQLKVHGRSHTGEKPFRCEHCPKSFPYRESLLVHQASHTGVKRFACSGCARTFTCIANLQSHRRSHRATCGTVPNNTKPLQNQ